MARFRISAVLSLCCLVWCVVALPEWTWISGNDTINSKGVYDSKGTPSINSYPGARRGAVGWFDSENQQLWVFGGYGYDSSGTESYLNDLWRYQVNDSTWTWISGSSSGDALGNYASEQHPGARQFPAGIYNSALKQFWMFGGYGVDSENSKGSLNDLWVFDVNTLTWQWISGSDKIGATGVYGEQGTHDEANVPGARKGAVGWFDAANEIWLFGGSTTSGSITLYYNDLWNFKVDDGQWAWISGSDTADQHGVYGTKGSPVSTNVPGARHYAAGWFDSTAKHLWLFGGTGYSSSLGPGLLNDLWKYDINDGKWTWMSGLDDVEQPGVYGTKGNSSDTFFPGARDGPSVAYDSVNKEAWLFGGYGFAKESTGGFVNDLWIYRVDDNTWSWVAGSDVPNSAGQYGNQGTPDPDNAPGARCCGLATFDTSTQQFWLFGGYYANTGGDYNDVWMAADLQAPDDDETPVEPPTDETPTEEPLYDETPTEEPAEEETPIEEPAYDETPTEEPAEDETPTEEPASDETPTEEPAEDEAPIEDETPVEPPSESEPTGIPADKESFHIKVNFKTTAQLSDDEKNEVTTATCAKVQEDAGIAETDVECTITESANKRQTYAYTVTVSFNSNSAATQAASFYGIAELEALAVSATQSVSSKLDGTPTAVVEITPPISSPQGFNNDVPDNGGLSPGSIAGIVIACILGAVVIVVILYVLLAGKDSDSGHTASRPQPPTGVSTVEQRNVELETPSSSDYESAEEDSEEEDSEEDEEDDEEEEESEVESVDEDSEEDGDQTPDESPDGEGSNKDSSDNSSSSESS